MNDACTFSVSKYFGASINQILRIFFGNFHFLIETTITKLSFGLFQVIKPVPNNYYQIFICWFNYDTCHFPAHSDILFPIQIKFLRLLGQN